MTVAKYVAPNYTDPTQTASIYKGNIDAGFSVVSQIGQQFAPHAQDVPAMTVLVDAGRIIKADGTLVSQAQQTTAAFTAPVTNPRIDRIVIDQVTGAISVIAGTEAVSPVAPAITAGKLPCAQVSLVISSTSITNAMLTDERAFIEAPAVAYTATGTDTYTATGLVSTTGYDYHVTFTNANTSTIPTLNGTTIVKEGAAALVAGDIPAGHAGILRKTATQFVLMNPVHKRFRGALVGLTANQPLPNNASTAILFTTEVYNTDVIHDNVTNTSRLTVPSGVTRIKLVGKARYGVNANGDRVVLIYKNGSSTETTVGYPSCTGVNSGTADVTYDFSSSIVTVSGGDYFELIMFQNGGAGIFAVGGSTWMSMEIIE